MKSSFVLSFIELIVCILSESCMINNVVNMISALNATHLNFIVVNYCDSK